MKKNKGISLILIIIIISILVIAVCAVIGIIIGTKRTNKEDTNIQIVNEISKEENIITNTVKKEEKKEVKELIFTQEYLLEGKISGNVQIQKNAVNNIIVLSITGKSQNDINNVESLEGKNRWYNTIDLTDYNTLEFYARNGGENGDVMIFVDNRMIEKIRYSELPITWTKYQVDLSKFSGKHVLSIAGGYEDMSGSENSNTQYCNIKLK